MYPGQYPQPNPRKTQFEAPMISGYATARLYSPLLATTADPPDNFLGCSVTFTNQMPNTVKLSLVPLADDSVPVLAGSGARVTFFDSSGTNLGSYLYISGGGEVRANFKTTLSYLELFADGGGPAQVRVQLESLIEWEHRGFDRLDPKYPPQLYQPNWKKFPWPS